MQPGRRRRATICSACIGAPAAASTASASALASKASTASSMPVQCRPMPVDEAKRTANAGRCDELILRPVAAEHLADFEQRRHRESRDRRCACAAATRPGSRLGRMSERSAAIGLASASSALPPPNNSACGLEMNDQVTASTMPRAASARLALAGAQLDRRQHRLARRPRRARTASSAPCRRRRCARFPRPGRPCRARRRARTAPRPSPPGRCRRTHEAEAVEDAPHLGKRHVDAGEPLRPR